MRVRNATSTAALTALLAFGLSACDGSSDNSTDDANGSTATPSVSASSSEPSSQENSDDCFVHLFDEDDFDESDSNFKLTKPGKYEDLTSLPGADQDWTDEADSIKVGSGATVTIWSTTGFGGTSTKLDPGSEHPDVDEPSSLEMTC